MENGTRVQKGIINMLAGSLGTLIMGVIQFASRIVFIQFLSDEYLGISSLFTNIMSILSLTELGIGNAVAFALYQPLADADREKIKSIMKFLQKTYMLIGIVIVGLGAVLFPFMPWLIAGNTDLVNINLIFLFYVLQSASSYWFFSYKGILLQADQKMYVIKAYTIIATFFVTIIQLVTLALWRDFILYSLIGLFTNVLVNILVACKVDKQYPFIRDKQHIAFSKEEKQNLFKNVLGMSLFKINTTIVNSTDNIVISAFVNLKMVALYGNYQLIISGISQVVMGFFGGITATIGNINVEEDKEKKEFIFRCIQFLCYWLYTFGKNRNSNVS